jgi:CO/xanthine dehydrogenase FAD-binding subunit
MHYVLPKTIDETVEYLLQLESPQILAGGTDLLVKMRQQSFNPGAIVDIKQLPETNTINIVDGVLIVGAAVSGAVFNEHQAAVTLWPGVAEAFDLIGSTQIQGRATLGGNLCNASPAADTVPSLIAAGAVAKIYGPDGERELAVENVNRGPGINTLQAGEFIVSFHFPQRPHRSGDAYLRFIPRTEMDIAVVGVGINLSLDERDLCYQARVSVGAVAPTALRLDEAAKTLIGTPVNKEALYQLATAVSAACKPINDKRGTIEYRTQVAGVLAKRVALIAMQRAQS